MKENRKLEYKQEINDSFLKTVSAFANYDGIKPNPDYRIFVNRDNSTITLKIEPGVNPPYYYKQKAYKRNDTSTIEVDNIELNRLILQGEHLNFEETESKNKELSFEYLGRRMCEVLEISNFNSDILKTLNLYSSKNGYNKAALIFSDQNSIRGIDIARFGDSMSIFLDRETFEGYSILEAFDKAIGMFEKYYSYEEIVGTERKKIYKIPFEAYREALANAVVHRTWDIDARIRVSMFEDRIEIASPGGLPFGLSKEEYLNGQVSIFRNPIISNVFFRLRIIETFGTGILKIRRAYENTGRKPLFNIFENSITVILPVKNSKIPVTADEQKIVDFLSEGIVASSSEIAASGGFGKTKTVKLLHSLIQKRIIVSEGSGRGIKYKMA